jgi:hypothetical protein
MAAIYCKGCGKIIGFFFSILDPDSIFTNAKNKHKPFCEGRSKSYRKGIDSEVVDILSNELKGKPNA